MKKLTKIAAAIIAAMTMATSMVGISASAACTPTKSRSTDYGTMTGSISISSTTPRTITLKTTTALTAYKLSCNADIDVRSTGELVFQMSKTEYNSTEAKKVSTRALYVDLEVSAFGAHQAQKANGTAWVVYTSYYPFTI